MRNVQAFLTMYSIIVLMASCRQEVIVWPSESETAGNAEHGPVTGFYLLNEGNMGSNKCTLDYYDYTNATYTRNIYGNANPDVVKELGDVGNDLQIYGSKLWAVINCSNKVALLRKYPIRRKRDNDQASAGLSLHMKHKHIVRSVLPLEFDGSAFNR